jgi:hypothetical protein
MKIEKHFPIEGREDFFKYVIVDEKGNKAKGYKGKVMYFEESQFEQANKTLNAILSVKRLNIEFLKDTF